MISASIARLRFFWSWETVHELGPGQGRGGTPRRARRSFGQGMATVYYSLGTLGVRLTCTFVSIDRTGEGPVWEDQRRLHSKGRSPVIGNRHERRLGWGFFRQNYCQVCLLPATVATAAQMVAATIRTVFVQPDAAGAHEQWHRVVETLRTRFSPPGHPA